MNIYAKIKQYPNFTNAEQLVADFILAKPQEFIGLSMEEISTICYVSSPTIYRFCKKLGLSG
ncbi:MAG: MurR/RpiR family transcriptional regulator, partial [Erysipelotrichaceae bacterium]|nr:MurR/RpiR family transcriptional regulator [Erysipelotrichaceae bacterium]